jgi:hypothetical protein
MISLAFEHVAFAVNIMRTIVSRITLTNLCVSAVTVSTTLRAVRNITEHPCPSFITPTLIRFIGKPVDTGRITNWRVTIESFIAIEAFTDFRG